MFAVEASSRKVRPLTPAGETICGVPFSVSPMKPTLTPSIVRTAVAGRTAASCGGVEDVGGEILKSRAGKTRRPGSRRPDGTRRAAAAAVPGEPRSNSWLPTDESDSPIAFSDSMAGSS